MKNYIIPAIVALIPLASFAETQEKQNKEDKEIVYVYVNEQQESQINAVFFIETYVGIYANTTEKLELPYDTIKVKTNHLNANGSLALGLDVNGVQLGFIAKQIDNDGSDTSFFGLKFDMPFVFGKVQPFISLIGGVSSIDIEEDDISESAFSYGIGGGVRYNFNENAFAKLGLLFESVTYDFDDYDTKYKISGLSLQLSMGYKF